MNYKNLAVPLVGLVILGVGASYLINKPADVVRVPVGATPGTDFPSDVSFGGIDFYRKQTGFISATTTPCAFKSPGATTTVVFTVSTLTGTSTALTFDVATSTSPNATTTTFGTKTIGAAERVTMIAGVSNDTIVFPNTYVVLGVKGGTLVSPSGAVTLTGTCQATFTGVN